MHKEYIPREIESIKFEIMTEEETKSISVVGVTSRDLYTSEGRAPANTGPLDLRLGPSTKDNICSTCGETMVECAGHFGHIDLPVPIYHPGLLRSTHKILQAICKRCAHLLLPAETISVLLNKIRARKNNRPAVQRVVKKVLDETKKATECFRCGAVNGVIRRAGFRFFHRVHRLKKHDSHKQAYVQEYRAAEIDNVDITPWTGAAPDEYISPTQTLSLMQKMQAGECELLGMFCSPSSLLLRALPVAPGTIRPSVVSIDASSNEDDLTIKLSEIVYTAQQIRDEVEKGASLHTLSDTWDLLQIQCAQLISTDTRAESTRIRSLVQRLKGKHGRFRGNLSGKRVEFSGRTVISPDPNLSVEEVGIPRRMAQTLSIPTYVTDKNVKQMQEVANRGCDTYPGANYLVREKKRLFLRSGHTIKVKKGDILERHLCTGDVVLFNRQPSLHKLSIMAHKVKVLPGRTLRFNECVCAPYNADFDGDEMNVHVPQTIEARVEALELMGVQNNLVVPRNGQPLIAATQDFITGAYLISSKETLFSSEEAAQIMADACTLFPKITPTILRPKRLYTGKNILQNVLGLTVTAEIRTREYKAGDTATSCKESLFVVRKGEILFGRVDKRVVGGEEGSVLHYEMREKEPSVVVNALNGLARVCARYMGRRGFSIGLDDVHATGTLKKQVASVIEACEKKATSSGEDRIISILSSAREKAGSLCVKELGNKNSAVVMQACGSKGSLINVSQMVGSVGQQIVGGQRIGLDFGERALPHFGKEMELPLARGFVRSSFCAGLKPTEFFFHAVSGREGLVDTAVKTAETGYMQRRLMKVLEGVHVAYDNTVRRGEQLIQMRFGDDGLDPSLLQGGTLTVEIPAIYEWAVERGQYMHEHGAETATEEVDKEAGQAIEQCSPADKNREIGKEVEISSKNDCRIVYRKIEQIILDKWSGIYKEEKIDRDIWNIVNKEIGYALFTGRNDVVIGEAETYLQRKVRAKNSLAPICFLAKVLYKTARAQIECGSAVGALAAQSIGEPGTQMTLKTFHLAGTSGASITLGVPRLKEIINGAVNISTPLVKIETKESVEVVMQKIRPVSLRDIASAVSIGDMSAIFEIEKERVKKYGIEKQVKMLGMSSKENLYTWEVPLSASTPAEIEKYLKTHVAGVQSVSRILCTDEGLLAEGVGLQEILGVEEVDSTTTRTNNIYEIYRTLGIEAAREAIVREIQYTIGKHGISVDVRHVGLLADVMCFTGEVCGMTRFGLQKMGGSSVLTLASFEQTGEHLFSAGYAGYKDAVCGVSECIITGQRIQIGTGTFKVCYDAKEEE